MTLTEFLLARIAEDEEQANRRFAEWSEGGLLDLVVTLGPARVLAECEAKRRIVELHGDDAPNCMGGYIEGITHRRVIESEFLNGVPTGYCDTLRALALPYADHPDYRDEWKP